MKKPILLGSASLCAAGLLSTPLAAQSVAELPEKQASSAESWTPSNTIIVTGSRQNYAVDVASITRTPVPLIEVPQSIQVLTDTLIREQELNTLDEALRNISGVIPSLSSELVLANPIVRGFEAEIFMDGLIGYADTAVADPASLIAVERIEVAKGATSALFGGGTGAPVGGLINIVSKTAEPGTKFSVRGRAGSFDTWQIGGDANLQLDDNLSVRLIAEYQDAGDAIDAVTIERFYINGSVRALLPTETEIIARFTHSRVEQLEYVGLPSSVVDLPSVDPLRFSGATNAPPTVVENLSADFSLSQPIGDNLTFDFRARRYENDFREFATTTISASTNSEFPLISAQLPASVDEWTLDASFTAVFDTGPINHTLLVGGQYDATHYEAASGFNFVPLGMFDFADPDSDLDFGEIPTLNNFIANEYDTTAFYVQDQISLFDRLHILASVRYSELTLRELLGGNGNRETYKEWDPRIGATFDIVDGLAVFAGYAEGSRLSIFFNNRDEVPEPERARNYEAGIKIGLSDIGLSGTVAWFDSTRSNVPTADPNAEPPNLSASIQTGEQRSEGVELDLIWEPNSNWSFLLSYAYTDARVTADTEIPVGDALPRVPKHAGRIAVRYRFNNGALDGLAVGAGLTAASRAELTLPNNMRSDSYAIFDAQASYDWGPARLGLRIDNIFDAQYFLPYQYLAQSVVRPGNPRSAFVTLNFDF
ncbi:TonB-dependent siderophore receptor [Parasphingorhabdus cellanae]|uniref:TonB-dependent siderophore receptor n=1 Tax=Parasphingorhabdus cellanae TaxID=2806553 RepID=A0ABX7T5J4_9SPHN|nr:TonB-dependent siderophore receptor [Parasphingorhabdus cellanae]QTD56090.1 TonB-dependent siderophore receptor [Parasphingorhabdus cellanae]